MMFYYVSVISSYGNTSSSSIWYEMNYIRNFGKLKVGERVLQVAFGSGFKCNSAVWLCINNDSKRPGRRTQISDREREREELEKDLDEAGYIKRRSKTLVVNQFSAKGLAENKKKEEESTGSDGPKLTAEALRKRK